MNGVHDMGGMHGMGPIQPELNEPVFHEPWEGRVYALYLRIGRWGRGRNWGSSRFRLESIPAAEYLRLTRPVRVSNSVCRKGLLPRDRRWCCTPRSNALAVALSRLPTSSEQT